MDENVKSRLAQLLSGDYQPPAPSQNSALARLLSSPAPSLMDQAKQQYPILQGMDMGYTFTPRSDSGFMEYWPANEPGAANRPRPQALPMEKPGLEVYRSDARPIDVLGDVVSHQLVDTDPVVKNNYQDFMASMNPEQYQTLRDQYDYARKNNGEQRSYDQWAEVSGIPAYFRGYAFQQWPQEATDKMYTQGQRNGFDSLMNYLSGKTR